MRAGFFYAVAAVLDALLHYSGGIPAELMMLKNNISAASLSAPFRLPHIGAGDFLFAAFAQFQLVEQLTLFSRW